MLSTISARSRAASLIEFIDLKNYEVEENVMLAKQTSDNINDVGDNNNEEGDTTEGTSMTSGGFTEDATKVTISMI